MASVIVSDVYKQLPVRIYMHPFTILMPFGLFPKIIIFATKRLTYIKEAYFSYSLVVLPKLVSIHRLIYAIKIMKILFCT